MAVPGHWYIQRVINSDEVKQESLKPSRFEKEVLGSLIEIVNHEKKQKASPKHATPLACPAPVQEGPASEPESSESDRDFSEPDADAELEDLLGVETARELQDDEEIEGAGDPEGFTAPQQPHAPAATTSSSSDSSGPTIFKVEFDKMKGRITFNGQLVGKVTTWWGATGGSISCKCMIPKHGNRCKNLIYAMHRLPSQGDEVFREWVVAGLRSTHDHGEVDWRSLAT